MARLNLGSVKFWHFAIFELLFWEVRGQLDDCGACDDPADADASEPFASSGTTARSSSLDELPLARELDAGLCFPTRSRGSGKADFARHDAEEGAQEAQGQGAGVVAARRRRLAALGPAAWPICENS